MIIEILPLLVPVATAPAGPVFAPYAVPATAIAGLPAGVAVARRPFTPRDCVTSNGCAVRALKEAGLAKRSADPEAEAEAEAAALYYGRYGYRYPAYGYGYYGHGLGYYGYGLHTGVGLHAGGGSSFVARSPQGLGK